VYLLTTPAPEEGIIFDSFLLLNIAVLEGMLGIFGPFRIVIIIL
jgi:hypothetical protein